jgi:hypothetical protein
VENWKASLWQTSTMCGPGIVVKKNTNKKLVMVVMVALSFCEEEYVL